MQNNNDKLEIVIESFLGRFMQEVKCPICGNIFITNYFKFYTNQSEECPLCKNDVELNHISESDYRKKLLDLIKVKNIDFNPKEISAIELHYLLLEKLSKDDLSSIFNL